MAQWGTQDWNHFQCRPAGRILSAQLRYLLVVLFMVCVTWDGQISFLAVLIYFDVLELIALLQSLHQSVELQRFETHVSW